MDGTPDGKLAFAVFARRDEGLRRPCPPPAVNP